ncbi:hypothetical protein CKO35_06650 [Ectothiorhodospira shaposhnikovii]|uniref:hypothetical protein n=1 Tax=Ectothiorhodospira shaposhnikovii TaxID=1054 RepID=UPI001904D2D7|nr:hypothetical protein [Ectothiorhodospira shaposhnikovii]MBK1672989.1 hypothetical protein [Ectothiorhodospira shaposhnikovii]
MVGKKRFLSGFLLALLGFSLLVLVFISVSVFFVAFLMDGGDLFGVLDVQLFNTILVQNSTEYLALIIGLPVSILVSLVALSLAYLAHTTALRDERREAQYIIKEKRDAALEAFSVMALAINRLVVFSSLIAKDLQEINIKYSNSILELGHEDHWDENEVVTNRRELKKEKGRCYRNKLLELYEFTQREMSPALRKLMSNALCLQFFFDGRRVACGEFRCDPFDHLVELVECGGLFINSLSDEEVVNVVERNARLCWSGFRVEGDGGAVLHQLFPPQVLNHSGVFVAASMARPLVRYRAYDDHDCLLLSYDDPELSAHELKAMLDSSEYDQEAKDCHYVGPILMSWLISCFPSKDEFNDKIISYFESKTYGFMFDDIRTHISPNQLILKEVLSQNARLSEVIGYRFVEEENLVMVDNCAALIELAAIERVHQAAVSR